MNLERLNRSLHLGHDRAFTFEDELTAIYGEAFVELGTRVSDRFRATARTGALVAAGDAGPGNPDWTPPTYDELVNLPLFDADAEARALEVHKAALAAALPRPTDGLGVSLDVVSPFAQPLLEQVGTKGVNLGLAARDVIVKVIGDSYDEGLSVQDTAVELKQQIDHLSMTTARMQARTDLNGLANGASVAQVQALGDASLHKQWLATEDERTRPTHLAADGQVVPLDQPFTVGLEPLMYPGDPTGSDGEVINCRCTVIYTDDPTEAQTRPELTAAPDTFTQVKRLDVRSTHPVYSADLNGQPVIVKPDVQLKQTQLRDWIAPGTDLQRELAAYRVAEHLRTVEPALAPRVPAYRIDDVPSLGRAGVSDRVEGPTVAQTDGIKGAAASDVRNGSLYDTIIGNLDRNEGNVIRGSDGLHLIDHGLSFPSENIEQWPTLLLNDRAAALGTAELTSQEVSLVDRLIAGEKTDGLRTNLEGLLTEVEINAMYDRLEWLATQRRLPTKDDWRNGL